MVIFVHRRHIILYHIHAFLKLTKQLPVQTTKWTRMLPCFLGSLQLPDGDCKVSWELPRFRMDAPSENLWSFEEHFCCFYFQRLNAFMATLARNQNLDSVAGRCACQHAQTTATLFANAGTSKLPRQTQDGGASARNALSHRARMLLVNLSLINKAERKDNNVLDLARLYPLKRKGGWDQDGTKRP